LPIYFPGWLAGKARAPSELPRVNGEHIIS
jgi:hypothetical protein